MCIISAKVKVFIMFAKCKLYILASGYKMENYSGPETELCGLPRCTTSN